MIAGSSALFNEGNKQIVTPKLRVELRQNSYGVSWRGASMATEFYQYGKAILWKDKMIVGKDVYNVEGTTRISTTPVADSYLDLGDTLAAYGGVSTLNIQRYYSNNGTSWYNGETLWHGTSIIDALQVTSEDTMYYRRRRGITALPKILNGPQWYLHGTEIRSRVDNGVTWNENIIDDDISWNQGVTQTTPSKMGNYSVQKLIGARGVDGLDYLFYQYGASVMQTANLYGYNLRAISSDGDILFKKETLLEAIDQHSGIHQLSNDLSIGPSHYYMAVTVSNEYYLSEQDKKWSGSTGFDFTSYGIAYLKSANLKDWSTPIVTKWKGASVAGAFSVGAGSTTAIFRRNDEDGLGSYTNPVNIVAGLSNEFDFRMIIGISSSLLNPIADNGGVLRDYFTVYKGSSTLDISDDIISYKNKDNDRISLKLGNMK